MCKFLSVCIIFPTGKSERLSDQAVDLVYF